MSTQLRTAVDTATPDDLAKMVRVLTDAALRQRLSAAGLVRAQDFRWDRICEQYEDVYAGRSSRAQEAAAP